MSHLISFNFETSEIRVVEVDNEPWFVLSDVLKAMQSATKVTDAKTIIATDLGDEFVKNEPILDNLNRQQNVLIINEPALTFVLSRSKTELGKKMNRWIHVEVLPSIRKSGIYQTIPFKLNDDSQITYFEQDDYWTTTTVIAEIFGKEHYNVIRDVQTALEDALRFEGMSENLPEFKCIESTYMDKYSRTTRMLKINRALFNYVVLSYTGNNAKLYRMMFIKAFEDLEKKLKVYLCQQMLYTNTKRQQVYVLQNTTTGLVKIGITNDINRRIAELQNASGCEIDVKYLSPKSDNAQNIEKTLHNLYKNNRGIGEWFNVDPDIIIEELTKQELVIIPTDNVYNLLSSYSL